MMMLTEEEIEEIAKKYIRRCGGHWEHEDAIPEHLVEDFAREIENKVNKNRLDLDCNNCKNYTGYPCPDCFNFSDFESKGEGSC